MRRMKTAVFTAMIAAALPAAALAQSAPAAAGEDAAKLAEAHAILGIMFPPERRNQIFQTVLTQVATQVEQIASSKDTSGDAGVDAILAKFKSDAAGAARQVILDHLPQLMEANAQAYTHEFSLDELKQIHAFAQTPAGSHYMSRAAALVSDPSVVAANSALGNDARTLIQGQTAKLRSDLAAYFKAHPGVAEKVNATAEKKK